MKAFCIIGSPREDGSTARIMDKVIEGMRSAGIEAKRYALGSLGIGYCRGCRTCRATRACVQADDMNVLIEDLFSSEIIVIGSPSYWGDVTAQLKTFIDRSLPLCNARTGETSVPAGKVGVSVAVRSGSDPSENRHLIETIEHYFGHLGITPVACLTVEGVSEPNDLPEAKLQEAYDLGAGIPYG